MGKQLKILIGFLLIFSFFSNAFAAKKKIDEKKLSEAIGNIIGKNLDDLGFKLDLKNLIKGIKNGAEKKPSSMSSDECLEVLAKIQMKENEKLAQKNLEEATNFLKNNLKEENVVEIEKEKLQYKIIKKGNTQKVEAYQSPIVKITGRYLDGTIFVNSEETIILEETLPALKKAIISMNLHEKRKVFIHPDLIYGKEPPHLNSLAIFDIEIIDLDAKKNPLEDIANNTNIF